MNEIDYMFLNPLPPQGYFYDPTVKAFDSSFWATLAGTPAISGGKIRLSAATIASYVQFTFGVHRFNIALAAVPTSGQSREWGLFNPAGSEKITIKIAGAVATLEVIDTNGHSSSVALNAALFTVAVHTFEIDWTDTHVVAYITTAGGEKTFLGQVLFTQEVKGSALPFSWYVKNAVADNFDVAYVGAHRVGRIN